MTTRSTYFIDSSLPMGSKDVWYVKFIGEIGGTNAVYGHFIERPENLQERLQ